MFDWSRFPVCKPLAEEPQYEEIVNWVNIMSRMLALHRIRSGNRSDGKKLRVQTATVIAGRYNYECKNATYMLAIACKALGIVSKDAKMVDFADMKEDDEGRKILPRVLRIDLTTTHLPPEAMCGIIGDMLKKKPETELLMFYGTPSVVDSFRENCTDLAAHIPADHWLELHGYTETLMASRVEESLLQSGCVLSAEAKESLPVFIRKALKDGYPANTNGANLLVQYLLANQARRISETDVGTEEAQTIAGEDIPVVATGLSIEEELQVTMAELGKMIGIPLVKQRVRELKATAQVAQERAAQGISASKGVSKHMIFTGNAGTGKTTVARLIARIYYLLGLLENDRVVVATRSDLVAGFLGQTAIKTKAVIQSAMGGVLFIDEAYSLIHGHQDSYGMEAIDTLLTEMENNRDRLIVILAGYEDKMKELLATNQGLSSRFPKTNAIHFPDYTEDELIQIYRMIVTQRGQTLSGVTNADLQALISKHRKEDADFGNARGVRNLVESAERSRDYRIAPRLAEIDSQELTQLTKEDVLGYSVKPERKQYLTTTFHEREEAKKLGAKWDKYAGKWYVLYKEGDSLAAFSKWLPKEDESRV